MLKILRSRGSIRAPRETEPIKIEYIPEERLRDVDLVSLHRSAKLSLRFFLNDLCMAGG